MFFRLAAVLLGIIGLAVASLPGADAATSLRVVTVGGGPEPDMNQLSIESNVRYWNRVLPAETKRTTLYADGSGQSAIVQVEKPKESVSPGEEVLNLIFQQTGWESAYDYQLPALGGALDGPASRAAIAQTFRQIETEQRARPGPLLAYFTGHGDEKTFALWGQNQGLRPTELAAHIARLPPQTSVALIMVQCHSGIFGNLLYEKADVKKPALRRDLVGFFATLSERPAAGCTPEINESEYHDFSSYFFAALTGQDRLGRPVTGADFDQDGVVTMHEAFCYTLLHDISIDVPICTTDVFLTRFATLRDGDVFQTPFPQILAWASPAQRAALNGLAAKIKDAGAEARLLDLLREATARNKVLTREDSALFDAEEAFKTRCRTAQKQLQKRWPDLSRLEESERYERSRSLAVAALDQEVGRAPWADLKKAGDELAARSRRLLAGEIEVAQTLRLLRLARTVVLTHYLRTKGGLAVQERFERLLAAENKPLWR